MKRKLTVALALWALVGFCALAHAESAAVLLEKGIYAEETAGDLHEAIGIYRQVLQNAEATRGTLAEAHYHLAQCLLKTGEKAQAVGELDKLIGRYPDLAETHLRALRLKDRLVLVDPAMLMPPETLFYYELGSPGEQVEKLVAMFQGTPLESALATWAGPGGVSPNQILSALLNPSMIEEFKKVRGLALGVTSLQAGQPTVVAVLYPGESDALRGLLLATIGVAARPAVPVAGMQTVRFAQGPGGCAYDDNAFIFAMDAEQLVWTTNQYKSVTSEPSLATANVAFVDLDREQRQRDAATTWVNVSAVMQAVRQMPGAESPQLAMIDRWIDLDGISSITIRSVLDETAPFAEWTVQMMEGHQSPAYDLFRTPPVTADGFAAVPADALAAVSVALSPSADNAQAQMDALRNSPLAAAGVAAGMDIGGELIGSTEQITLFLVPPRTDDDSFLGREAPAATCLGLVVTSRDPGRTRALVGQLLGFVDSMVASTSGVVGEPPAGKYRMAIQNDEPIYCHVGQEGKHIVVALSPATVEAAVQAVKTGRSAVKEGVLSRPLQALAPDVSKVVLVNLGGAFRLVAAQAAAQGALPAEQAEMLARLADATAETNLQLLTTEGPNHLRVHSGVDNLPDMAAVLPLMMELSQSMGTLSLPGTTGPPLPPEIRNMPAPKPVGVPVALNDITIDGSLDDWQGVPAMPMAVQGDLEGSVSVCWSEAGLYFAVEAPGQQIAVNPASPWLGDALTVHVDAAYSRAEWWQNAGAIQVFTGPAQSGIEGRAFMRGGFGLEGSGSFWSPCAWRRTTDGYTLEALVPAATLAPARMAPNTVMGLQFVLTDESGKEARFHDDSNVPDAWGRPIGWGAVVLSGQPRKPVPVSYGPREIGVDGDLSDWEGIKPMPLPYMGRDTSSVRMCWTEQGLYVGVQAKDDAIAVNPAEPWTADSVEVFLDKALSRAVQSDATTAQYILSPTPETNGGICYVLITQGADRGKEGQLQATWSRTPDGYTLEALIPAAFIGPDRLAAGSRMGLHFALNNDGKVVEQFYCDKDESANYMRPIAWGVVELVR